MKDCSSVPADEFRVIFSFDIWSQVIRSEKLVTIILQTIHVYFMDGEHYKKNLINEKMNGYK